MCCSRGIWVEVELIPGEAKVHDVAEKGTFSKQNPFHGLMCYTIERSTIDPL